MAGFIRLRKDVLRDLPEDLIKGIKKNAKKYSEFPKYAFFPALLNIIVLSALTFQILAKFTITQVGYAELTTKMLMIPSALAGASLGQLILQRFSSAYNNKTSTRKLFTGLFLLAFLITIPFFVIIHFWGPELFAWVFGKEWTESGRYARILITGVSIQFVISPFGQVLIAFHKIKTNSFWEFGKFLVIMSLFFISFSNIQEYLRIYNLLLILVYAAQIILILYAVVKYEKSVSSWGMKGK
jgi:O-antigen/teichoic acid export membrane protein